jgi:4-hydroxy-3-polyprenylbenzoate decarboxylase
VYVHPQGGARFFVAISVRQRYPGHARQVLMAAAAGRGIDYLGKYIVVVDEDVDVFDLDDVLWALFTRTDPVSSLTIIDRCWSGPLDPAIPPERRGMSSRCLIDACRPWEWRDRFPEAHSVSADLRRRVRDKWPEFWS